MSTYEKIVITGMGHFHPENIISNQLFESLDIGTSNEWIVDRTGIENRRSVLTPSTIKALRHHELKIKDCQYMTIAECSQKPWQLAKTRSNFDKKLDILICGTSVPDFDIPANASTIAKQLELDSITFDVNSACSSFVSNLLVGKSLLHQQFSNLAIFNTERYTTKVDYADRANCILFGDGATAAIIEKGQNLDGLEIVDIVLHSDSSGCDFVKIPIGSHFSQDGQKVQKFAITKTCEATIELLARNNLTTQDLHYFIGHQANLRMLETAIRRLEIPNEKHLFNVDQFGNQGGAGAPSVLSQNWELFKAGDWIVVAVVGSGLTWGAALLRKVIKQNT